TELCRHRRSGDRRADRQGDLRRRPGDTGGGDARPRPGADGAPVHGAELLAAQFPHRPLGPLQSSRAAAGILQRLSDHLVVGRGEGGSDGALAAVPLGHATAACYASGAVRLPEHRRLPMYQVPQFHEGDLVVQHSFIRSHPLGLLTSSGPDGILANPIPFLLHGEGERGVLRCHLSRGNPQWQALQARPEVLVVSLGPEHYITPSWYPSKQAQGKAVPTWNYSMVQARGTARVIEDAAWLHAHVSALSDAN